MSAPTTEDVNAEDVKPTAPRQFAKVCEILERHERNAARLIPILQEVQEEYRYLPQEVLTFVATSLGLPPAHVYGVATFYSHFTLEPRGKYTIRLCDGTACHVRNSIPILEALWKRLGLSAQRKTTPDMLFTVETVSCLGACGLAPVVVVNDEVHGLMTPEKTLRVIDDIVAKEGV
ncbi:MAG: NAD(P)H-dependent oxidoreductase subunit E [Planctomycetota bacterium]